MTLFNETLCREQIEQSVQIAFFTEQSSKQL